jgi:PPOX class probable F420-dependent enzyme
VIRDEAVARIREAQVGRLATVRPDGSPHVIPFVFVLVGDGNDLLAYWVVDAKPKKRDTIQRISNIEANPMVEFVVDGYEEDWSGLWWVRAMGRARAVTSEEERRAALTALSGKYPQYETEPPGGPVIAIAIERVTGWSAAETRV